MLLNKETKSQAIGSVRFFGNTRVLILSALFIAASIVLGKYLSFTVGAIRISLENLTILMAGIMFGPLIGLAVGVGADIIGCLMVGYTISPIITLGAGCVGFFSGLFSMFLFKKNKTLNIAFAVAAAHIIGSMIVKSYGLHVYYGSPLKVLLLRVPLYLAIGTIEFIIISLIMNNKAFAAQYNRICRR